MSATRIKVSSIFAALEIASGPDPGVALLDLSVLVTLTRMVWDGFWQPEVYGEAADVMVGELRKLEQEIWSIAAKVLTSVQQREFRDLIEEWYTRNPEKKMVAYVRFSNFGELGRKPTLEEAIQRGGMFGAIREAMEEAERICLIAERALYSGHPDAATRELPSRPDVPGVNG